jgi:hypothetical protein
MIVCFRQACVVEDSRFISWGFAANVLPVPRRPDLNKHFELLFAGCIGLQANDQRIRR